METGNLFLVVVGSSSLGSGDDKLDVGHAHLSPRAVAHEELPRIYHIMIP